MDPVKDSVVMRFAGYAARLLPAPVKRVLYRMGPLTRLLRSLLNRSAPEGPVEVTIAGGPLAGKRMHLDLEKEKAHWLGTFELDLQAALKTFARPGMTAFDLGANIGYVTLLLSELVGPEGSVVAFEPHPQNLERLRINLALDGLYGIVIVVPAAVGRGSGSGAFLMHESRSMGKLEGSGGRQAAYGDAISVDVVGLDEFVAAHPGETPDLIKMDIEGGEVEALPGMRRVLAEIRPILILELHGPESTAACKAALAGAGYRALAMKAGYPEVEDVSTLGWKAAIVALPEEAAQPG